MLRGGDKGGRMSVTRPGRRDILASIAGTFYGMAALSSVGRADPIGSHKPLDWDQAAPLLRPKLLPAYFADAYPGLVRLPFSAKLVVAYAIDRGKTDEYIEQPMLKPWGVASDALHGRALANLEDMSSELPTAGTPPPTDGGALFVAKGDGYDAARLLLPKLRGRLLAQLGPEAFAAVPARDLLMMWPVNDAKQRDLVGQVAKENANRPHPLSTEIFKVTADAVRVATAEEASR